MFFSVTLGKIVVKTLAVLQFDRLMLNHLFIRKSRDCLTDLESFCLMGFCVAEVFKQVVDLDLKDAFDSDEAVQVLLVLQELATACPLKGDPVFSKDSKENSKD